MKHLKEKIYPAITEMAVDYITCDWCAEKITKEYGNAEEININHKTGYSYSDCGSGENTYTDICAKCFDEKLKPLLESHGVKFRTEEWDW